ncbi:MAG: hypothetical protein ACI3XC_07485 [Phascolarctobacterium sp.]
MKSKKTLALILVLAAVLCGAAFYFLYFVRTPAYALNQARIALKEHNTTKFEQYVDLQSVLDNAFEDIIKAESKINNDNLFSNPFAMGILHMLKPSVVDLMKQEALARIAAKPEQEEKVADPVPDAMRRNLERHIPLDKLSVKDLKLAKQEQGQATATLVLHDDNLQKDFLATLLMEANDKSDWQIKKISNLSELIIQFSAAKKAKQAAANKPIMERLNQSVGTSEVGLHIFQDPNIKEAEPQQLLLASVSATNKTKVAINRMYYDVTILDEKGKELYSYPEHFRGSIAPGATVQLETSKKLNALLPDDKRLLSLDLSKLTGRIQITYIAFDDGNVLSPNPFME